MGLFDFFRSKAKEPIEPEPAVSTPRAPPAPPVPPETLSPWQRKLWLAERSQGFAWKDDNEPARALVRSLLVQARRAFGDGKVVNGEPTVLFATSNSLHIARFGGGQVQVEDSNVELRGVWDGTPIRIPVSIPAKKIWVIEMRCAEKGRFFKVLRDHTRVPKAPDPNDPWEKSRQQCVFLGKGIFLDDHDPELTRDWLLPAWANVPVPAQQLVIEAMERLDLEFFELSNSNNALFALGNRKLAELEDPIAYMQSCAAFLAEFGKHLAASAGTSRASAQPVTCKYCSSIFILAAGENTCPNCGAAAEQ